jgi:Malectin domain
MNWSNDREAEETELRAVLSSGIFHAGSNSARLLEYVCTRYFDGDQGITEAGIAVQALGRRPDFDSKEDAIVRVEAHRVRKRLDEYYEGPGSSHRLRLVLPPGRYLPQFAACPDAVEEPPPAAARIEPDWYTRKRWWLLAAILLLTGGSVAIAVFRSPAAGTKSVARAPVQPAAVGVSRPDVRIMAGSSAKDYTDRLGHVWSADRFFDRGESWSAKYRKILRTDDVQLYLTSRQGKDFGYHIPLPPGMYELRLYFAETFYGEDNPEGGGESSRVFDVTANDAPLLTSFDPLSDAGGTNAADVRVFSGLSPASDGRLHLRFRTRWILKAAASVNGIEIVPSAQKAIVPIRWIPSDSARFDLLGRLWQPDQFVQGGRRREYREEVIGAADPVLYHSERYGNMSYAIPVSNGSYRLTMHFSEHWFGVPDYATGAGAGSRVFDVYCNGVALLRDFDIFKEAAGCLRPVVKVFHGLKANHQGKLLLSFVPTADYACVNAIEVVDESLKEGPSRR